MEAGQEYSEEKDPCMHKKKKKNQKRGHRHTNWHTPRHGDARGLNNLLLKKKNLADTQAICWMIACLYFIKRLNTQQGLSN